MTSFAPRFDAAFLDRETVRDVRDRLNFIATALDSAVRIPGTGIRVGADAFLNLIPGFGLLLSKGLSAYVIWEARRLGVPTSMLMRMVGNVGVDFVISAVPVVGWVGDAFYRANMRNLALLREHLDGRQPHEPVRAASRFSRTIDGTAEPVTESRR